MSELQKQPMVSTTTRIEFERNPNYGGELLIITHDEELNWGNANVRFKALYSNDMELVKRRNPLLIRLRDKFEEAYDKLLGTIALVVLSGVGLGTALFVLVVMFYLLGIFTGIEIIVK